VGKWERKDVEAQIGEAEPERDAGRRLPFHNICLDRLREAFSRERRRCPRGRGYLNIHSCLASLMACHLFLAGGAGLGWACPFLFPSIFGGFLGVAWGLTSSSTNSAICPWFLRRRRLF